MSSLKRQSLLISGLLLLVLVAASVFYFLQKDEGDQEKFVRHRVTRQSFQMEVSARGIVRPSKITPLQSAISGNEGKLLWIMPEGQKVKKGETVARFDSKPMQDNLQRAQQKLTDTTTQLEIQRKTLELLAEAHKGKEEDTQRKLEIARIKANDLKKGSGPLTRKEFEQAVREKTRVFRMKQKELTDLKPLLTKGFITNNEYDKVKNEQLTAKEGMAIAQGKLENFIKYEWPKTTREAEVIEDAAEMELARVQRTNALEQQQQMAKIDQTIREMAVKTSERDKAQRELDACEVHAPSDGIILYSTLPFGDKKRKIQIGDSIWFGQSFLEIPDTSELVVEVTIREIDVAKLNPPLPVKIGLDAYPGKVFDGEFVSIDSLARNGEESGVQRFSARIRFTSTPPEIRVGMSATVHIIYDTRKDVLAVPVQAIRWHNGKSWLVIDASGTEKEVQTGASGTTWIEITNGMQENDEIYFGSM